MRLAGTEALVGLRRMNKAVLTTEDASLRLGLSRSAASRMLARLGAVGLALRLRRGLWTLDTDLDPLVLAEYLTAPLPAYVSFQSALYFHGLISQVPQVIYVASLHATKRIATALGVYSIHRLAPSFFGGFRTLESGLRLATPEKALLDMLYLAPARSRLFAALPEVEIPRRFDRREARRWVTRIAPGPRRRLVERRLAALVHLA